MIKRFFLLFVSLFLLSLLIFLGIFMKIGNKEIKQQITQAIESKIHAKSEIGELEILGMDRLAIKNFQVLQNNDTFLAIKNIHVHLNLTQTLFSQTPVIEIISLDGLRMDIRKTNSGWNFEDLFNVDVKKNQKVLSINAKNPAFTIKKILVENSWIAVNAPDFPSFELLLQIDGNLNWPNLEIKKFLAKNKKNQIFLSLMANLETQDVKLNIHPSEFSFDELLPIVSNGQISSEFSAGLSGEVSLKKNEWLPNLKIDIAPAKLHSPVVASMQKNRINFLPSGEIQFEEIKIRLEKENLDLKLQPQVNLKDKTLKIFLFSDSLLAGNPAKAQGVLECKNQNCNLNLESNLPELHLNNKVFPGFNAILKANLNEKRDLDLNGTRILLAKGGGEIVIDGKISTDQNEKLELKFKTIRPNSFLEPLGMRLANGSISASLLAGKNDLKITELNGAFGNAKMTGSGIIPYNVDLSRLNVNITDLKLFSTTNNIPPLSLETLTIQKNLLSTTILLQKSRIKTEISLINPLKNPKIKALIDLSDLEKFLEIPGKIIGTLGVETRQNKDQIEIVCNSIQPILIATEAKFLRFDSFQAPTFISVQNQNTVTKLQSKGKFRIQTSDHDFSLNTEIHTNPKDMTIQVDFSTSDKTMIQANAQSSLDLGSLSLNLKDSKINLGTFVSSALPILQIAMNAKKDKDHLQIDGNLDQTSFSFPLELGSENIFMKKGTLEKDSARADISFNFKRKQKTLKLNVTSTDSLNLFHPVLPRLKITNLLWDQNKLDLSLQDSQKTMNTQINLEDGKGNFMLNGELDLSSLEPLLSHFKAPQLSGSLSFQTPKPDSGSIQSQKLEIVQPQASPLVLNHLRIEHQFLASEKKIQFPKIESALFSGILNMSGNLNLALMDKSFFSGQLRLLDLNETVSFRAPLMKGHLFGKISGTIDYLKPDLKSIYPLSTGVTLQVTSPEYKFHKTIADIFGGIESQMKNQILKSLANQQKENYEAKSDYNVQFKNIENLKVEFRSDTLWIFSALLEEIDSRFFVKAKDCVIVLPKNDQDPGLIRAQVDILLTNSFLKAKFPIKNSFTGDLQETLTINGSFENPISQEEIKRFKGAAIKILANYVDYKELGDNIKEEGRKILKDIKGILKGNSSNSQDLKNTLKGLFKR